MKLQDAYSKAACHMNIYPITYLHGPEKAPIISIKSTSV